MDPVWLVCTGFEDELRKSWASLGSSPVCACVCVYAHAAQNCSVCWFEVRVVFELLKSKLVVPGWLLSLLEHSGSTAQDRIDFHPTTTAVPPPAHRPPLPDQVISACSPLCLSPLRIWGRNGRKGSGSASGAPQVYRPLVCLSVALSATVLVRTRGRQDVWDIR